MKPKRIQLSRKKGFKLPPNTVVVSRPSKWGNPFRMVYAASDPKTHICIPAPGERERVVKEFAKWVSWNSAFRGAVKRYLVGKNLACWCKLSELCHADVLLELANK